MAAPVAAVAALILAPAAQALGRTPSGVGSLASTTETFNYTGSVQTWTVPAGVTSVAVVVRGAQGGSATYDTGSRTGTFGAGANGGSITATLNVTPGAILNINVGQKGGTATDAAAGAGGYNGGGASGVVSVGLYPRRYTGGGGGASDIRIGGTSLSNRVVVAGGGGGLGIGLGSGGTGGQTGGNGGSNTSPGAFGGNGATGIAGGTGGDGATGAADPCVVPGSDGSDGLLGIGGAGGGGNGGDAAVNHPAGGGGGGGGYYGGGGGGGACPKNLATGGGGGGSSYADPVLASSVSYTSGNRPGDGVVTITWTDPAPAIDATGSGRTISGSGSVFPVSSTVTFTIGGVTVGTATTDAEGDFTFGFADVACSIISGTLTATSGSATATDTFTLTPCPEEDNGDGGYGRDFDLDHYFQRAARESTLPGTL